MAETEDVAPGRSDDTPAPRARRAAAATTGTRRRGRPSAALHVDTDSLEAQVSQLQSDLKSVTTTLSRMGQSAGQQLKSEAGRQAHELADRGQSAIESAQDEFGAVERQVKDMIREKPLTAVFGAMALGFMIAVITR
jgi:ElaB/YqjD/DUF883 family membrane-anchored ribosome-binding protein